MDTLDWQNGYEAVLTDRIDATDTYIPVTPVPSTTVGRLVIEDNSETNYEIVHFNSVDSGGVFADVRDEDGNSTGVHAKGVRVRMNITAQDLREIRDAMSDVVDNYAMTTANSTATSTTITPDADVYTVSALASGASIAARTGTPTDGQALVIRIKDNGTSRSLSFTSDYVNISGLDGLTATTVNKWHVICCLYSSTAAKWQIVSISTEA